MAISPTPSNSSGPMAKLGNVARNSTEKSRQGRIGGQKEGARVQKQRARGDGRSRRAEEDAAAERARARRTEQNRGGRLDVKA